MNEQTKHKWLPSEPTKQMVLVSGDAVWARHHLDIDDDVLSTIGRAMWEAAAEIEPVQTLEELEQEIYENTQVFVPHNVMQWMLKRYRNHAPEVEPLDDETILGIARTIPNLSGDDSALIQFARELGV
jgi:hypothetical protein